MHCTLFVDMYEYGHSTRLYFRLYLAWILRITLEFLYHIYKNSLISQRPPPPPPDRTRFFLYGGTFDCLIGLQYAALVHKWFE
jgi:hypothetical protein